MLSKSSKNPSVHLIGIGGSGMQGLAKFLKEKGGSISGSDINPIMLEGVTTYHPHQVKRIAKINPQEVIYSPAIPENNEELQWALKKGIPVRNYPEKVGFEMKDKFGIAVAGTHGKSTTSSLINYILFKEGRDPSFVIGANVYPHQTNGRYGKGREMVVEACEYKKSFLSLNYDIAVINNIEEDHLDCYNNLEDITQSFKEFARKLKANGSLIIPGLLAHEFEDFPFKVCTVGKNSTDFYQFNRITTSLKGCRFQIKVKGDKAYKAFIPLFGKHNVLNAAIAIATAHQVGVPIERACRHLETVQAPGRRFEIHQLEPFVLIEDFAHHPTKIYRTFEACQQRFPKSKIHCVFQPHQHHRTRVFLNAFGQVLASAHRCLIPPIFSARDSKQEKERTNSKHLVAAINKAGGKADYFATWDKMQQRLNETVQPNDVVLILGAGDIGEFTTRILHSKTPSC